MFKSADFFGTVHKSYEKNQSAQSSLRLSNIYGQH